MVYAGDALAVISICLSKVAAALLFRRIAAPSRLQKACNALIGSCVFVGVASLVILLAGRHDMTGADAESTAKHSVVSTYCCCYFN